MKCEELNSRVYILVTLMCVQGLAEKQLFSRMFYYNLAVAKKNIHGVNQYGRFHYKIKQTQILLPLLEYLGCRGKCCIVTMITLV